MKRITLLIIAVLLTSTFVSATTGWFQDYLKLNVNGAGTAGPVGWYWIGTDPAYGTQLHGTALGSVSSLLVEGCDMKYWDDTQNRIGGSLNYMIKSSDGLTTFVAATEIIWDQTGPVVNDYSGLKTVSANLLTGVPYGVACQLHVWAKSWGGADDYLNNGGGNYVATFTRQTPTSFSGTYKVGTGGDFLTLSAAVTAINAGTITGNVVLEITSNITEPANFGLAVNTNGFGITVRPDADANRTITFTQLADNTSPTGHFVIGYSALSVAWADANTIATNNVTIDGYALGGTTRRLTFTNTAAAHVGARVVVVVGACSNTKIKNCIINNLTTSTASPFCVGGVLRKGTAIEVAPVGLTIENNVLTSTGNSVAMAVRLTSSGTPITLRITGFVFKNNLVTSRRRLLEINYTTGADISGNEFTTIQTGAPGTISYGLWTATGVDGTFKIYNNKFLKSTTEETGAFGHRVVSLASSATYEIYNNTFAGMNKTMPSTAALNLYYLFYGGVSGKIYNNTFYMPALSNATHTGGAYRAINLSGNTTEIKNNLFISDEATHTATSFISAVPANASDYNVFKLNSPHTGAFVVSTFADLASYQAANSTKDVNSKSVNANFVNTVNGDLRLAGASINAVELRAPRLTGVASDILGSNRSVITHIGAHEAGVIVSTTQNATDLALNASTDVAVSNTGVLNIDASKTINSLVIEAGGKATNDAGSILTANNFSIKSSVGNGTGTYVDNGTSNFAAANVEQYLAPSRNWYISSPVTLAPKTIFDASSSAVNTRNEVSSAWEIVNAGTLATAKGYVASVNGIGGTVVFSGGELNNGNQTISLTNTTSVGYSGFNLVGNPYPSYLKWISTTATAANTLPTIWYRTKDGANPYSFITYNAEGDLGVPKDATGIVPPMQAFWVKVQAGGGVLTFNNTMRTHADATTNKLKAPMGAGLAQKIIRLQVSDDQKYDEAVVYFNSNASDGFDGFDSPKMSNDNDVPEIYTMVGNEKLVINGLNTLVDNLVLPLGFSSKIANTFNIKATQVSDFDVDTKLYLRDNLLNNELDITNGASYSFSSDATTSTSRFSLLLKSAKAPNAVKEVSTENLNVNVVQNGNGRIVVQTANLNGSKATITVANSSGQTIVKVPVTETSTLINQSLGSGVYFVTLRDANRSITKKIIIN